MSIVASGSISPSVIAEQNGVGAEPLTLATAWQAISGSGFTDELLAVAA